MVVTRNIELGFGLGLCDKGYGVRFLGLGLWF